RVPSIDDETVYRVLEKLLVLEGQRLSYRALDVEQIGSVYEALMGYHVCRVASTAACLGPDRVWVERAELEELPKSRRAKWIKERTGLTKAKSAELADALTEALTQALGGGAGGSAGGSAGGVADLGTDASGAEPPGEPEPVDRVLAEHRLRGTSLARAGRLVLQPGEERRRTSSHYTPRSLSAPIVKKTLEPLLACMGEEPSSERLLQLKLCDPAMGSGAFLVEACRALADQVIAAWTREGRLEDMATGHEDAVTHARRLVAQRCLYGVDKNPFAVQLAKLSLWLVTLSRDLPFTFVDHALRCGDSLVGVDFDQVRAFHWQPKEQGQVQLGLVSQLLEEALDEAIGLRQEIGALDDEEHPDPRREKQRLLEDADDALWKVRLVADVLVGAFFAKSKPKERETERRLRSELVQQWLQGGERPEHSRSAEALAELREMAADLRAQVTPFHWMLELPEVFYAERPDPLEDPAEGEVNRAAFVDGFVGNPPFAGKNQITAAGGPNYLDWLKTIHTGAHGNADLVAHFFRRADHLLGRHGAIGLIATNTIAQGDTRATGLQHLAKNGHEIYDAVRSMPWPGDASVAVAVVHTAKGRPARAIRARHLDGERVEALSSRLRPKPERADPQRLSANAGASYVGSYVLGMGFTLTPEERDELVARDARNAERIFPYLGGSEVNTHPRQEHDRYVISFGEMSLEDAERWSDLIEIVREKVKPDRDRNKRAVRKKYWWRFGEVAPALYRAIAPLPRCLVNSLVSKHLVFAFQPTERIFSHKLCVYPFAHHTAFAVLQSRVHEPWARLLSSTLEERMNYSPSDCFETFPFPEPDPRAEIPALEEIGRELYEARAAFMEETWQGLTQTSNLLKDPAVTEEPIERLRRLHEDLDRAVLTAYGWDDLAPRVPSFRDSIDEEEAKTIEAFQDEIVDRLFVLNEERAKEEKRGSPQLQVGSKWGSAGGRDLAESR
ncbi:MAG TPA: DNA methyltransferase, partial [Planctomycetota bacterium]|nr:DNA methyltransferase [Planctomycetota bacterium]